ncbi:hypothetical protein [Methylobacterium oxalidis]|uniref:hypothetical protein n=1 Tax=Methylobacterium oxalidis TaxID=944322 RepID=UPI0033149C65
MDPSPSLEGVAWRTTAEQTSAPNPLDKRNWLFPSLVAEHKIEPAALLPFRFGEGFGYSGDTHFQKHSSDDRNGGAEMRPQNCRIAIERQR